METEFAAVLPSIILLLWGRGQVSARVLTGSASLILDLLAICWGCGGSVLMPNPLLPIPELLETTLSPAWDSILRAVRRRQNRVLPHGQVRETPVMHGCQLLGWQDWI